MPYKADPAREDYDDGFGEPDPPSDRGVPLFALCSLAAATVVASSAVGLAIVLVMWLRGDIRWP